MSSKRFLSLQAVAGAIGGAVDDAISPVEMDVEHVRIYQAPK